MNSTQCNRAEPITGCWCQTIRRKAPTGPLLMPRVSFRTTSHLIAAAMFLFCAAGCVRRDGRNSDCRWPGENVQHSASNWHLSQDAEFAEDLAIRYADVHHGLRTPYYVSSEDYNAGRDSCMATLFAEIARQHDVPVELVYKLLGRNRVYIDAVEVLPFALLYCFLVAVLSRVILRRYPPADGWTSSAIMMLLLSVGFALGGIMIGEVWSWFLEGYRVGNAHMSYRAQRLIWSRHPSALFSGALLLFWLIALEVARRTKSTSTPGQP
jgi:hypothetical protein